MPPSHKRPEYGQMVVQRGELILPIRTAQGLDELRYNPVKDRILHAGSKQDADRRFLLKLYRKYRRRVHGYGKGGAVSIGPVILSVQHLRPLLSACTLYRRRSRGN